MADSFSISRDEFSAASLTSMHEEIHARTLSDSATESILRSIERFGADESIRYYEVTPQQSARTRHHAAQAAWTVRAIR